MSITLSPVSEIEPSVRHATSKSTTSPVPAAVAVLCAGIVASIAGIIWQSMAAREITTCGVVVDRVTLIFLLLVMSIGCASLRFSTKYLSGESRQAVFQAYLLMTVLAASVFVAASDLRVLFVAWLLVSFGLQKLLTYYRLRVETSAPAINKLVISRIGDLILLVVITVIALQYRTYNILDINRLLVHAGPATGNLIAMLIATAALTQSAQFPFHSWLPETMEAPTPVSALMHAGVVNAGGVLLLRFAPLLVHAPAAMHVLVIAGTITVAIGTLSMWAQPTVKQKLAWSTVNQMGYMMIEIGVGAFSIAALHIVGHGFYKAWNFLASGSTKHAPSPVRSSPARRVAVLLLGTMASATAAWAIASKFGIDVRHSPTHVALLSIIAIAMGQCWAGCAGVVNRCTACSTGTRKALVGISASLVPLLACLLAVSIDKLTESYFASSLPAPVNSTEAGVWIAAMIPVAVIGLLSLAYTLLPEILITRCGRALYVHSLHGFYCGIVTYRFIALIRKMAARTPSMPWRVYTAQLQGRTGR